MLDSTISPIHRLVSTWWRSKQTPNTYQAHALRESLFAAALAEIHLSKAKSSAYDPFSDFRFKWAVQYIEVASHERRTIDPSIANLVTLFFNPIPPLSNKHLQAHDSP